MHVNAEAGANWDDFVAFTVELRARGASRDCPAFPAQSALPWCQNIGAYGQEVATSVESVEVWDRDTKTTRDLTPPIFDSAIDTSRTEGQHVRRPGQPADRFFRRHVTWCSPSPCPDPL